MNAKNVWWALFLVLAGVPYAGAQTAAMRDGRPSLECSNGKDIWSIAQTDFNGQPAFRVPVKEFRMGDHRGVLFITAERLIYQAQKHPQESFDEGRKTIKKWQGGWGPDDCCGFYVETTREYQFVPTADNGHYWGLFRVPGCAAFVDLAWHDFAAAEKQFHRLTRHLPPVSEAALREFQLKAAAWRAAPTKPPLSPETDRHRILAENALKEKNMDSAIEHYESALDIQPTWPAGWFNLALLYAEQKAYADATDAMKHYLELVPDASDAQQAREQMIIWDDKAKH
jgi:tetratricopeptide (TPR) repeat protein